MRKVLVLLTLFPSSLIAQTVHPNCTVWSTDVVDVYDFPDYTQHSFDPVKIIPNGWHEETGQGESTCDYGGGQYVAACNSACNVVVSAHKNETGKGYNPPTIFHQITDTYWGGTANATAAASACAGEIDAGVLSCPVGTSCALTAIQTGLNPAGIGVTVTWSPNNTLWTKKQPISNTCGLQKGPGCKAVGMPDGNGVDGTWVWSGSPICGWVWKSFGHNTPIIIDTDGSGYHLTSIKPSGDSGGGVIFNFWGGDSLGIMMSWIARGSTNGFLVIPTIDGKVKSGREMFGNISPQPGTIKNGDENGFSALSLYDSNHDGKIDDKDEVWYGLRIWIDSDHKGGVSDPKELHRLSEFGITSISLKYEETNQKDQYGNLFRWKGEMETTTGSRTIYDVVLQATRK